MLGAFKSLGSRSSLSTCSSEGSEGEVTPHSNAVRGPRSEGDATPSSISWADASDASLEVQAARLAEPSAWRAPAQRSKARAGAWRAVWCYERCYKVEEESARNAITQLVASFGGSLTCFKKASNFEAQVPRMACESYVLITDGREARPCVQVLATLPNNHPVFIVVISEQPKHAARVERWAEGLPEEGFHVPVFVVGSAADLAPILARSALPYQGFRHMPDLTVAPTFPFNLKALTAVSSTTSASSPMCMTSTSPSQALRRDPMGCGDATRTYCASRSVGNMDAMRSPLASWAVLAPSMGADATPVAPWPVCSEAPGYWEKSDEGVAPSVLCVLTAAVPTCADPGTIERLLTLSAPEVYED